MELNTPRDPVETGHLYFSIPSKKGHFLFGFVDIDKHGCASLFGSRIGAGLRVFRFRLGGRGICLCVRASGIRASFLGRWIGACTR
jgi:hypothetical protein